MDILSASPVDRGGEMSYDFTTSVYKAYGLAALKISEDGKPLMYAGDSNQDLVIQTTDYDDWAVNPSQLQVYDPVDLTMDGVIQATDYDAWFLNKSKLTSVLLAY